MNYAILMSGNNIHLKKEKKKKSVISFFRVIASKAFLH